MHQYLDVFFLNIAKGQNSEIQITAGQSDKNQPYLDLGTYQQKVKVKH